MAGVSKYGCTKSTILSAVSLQLPLLVDLVHHEMHHQGGGRVLLKLLDFGGFWVAM